MAKKSEIAVIEESAASTLIPGFGESSALAEIAEEFGGIRIKDLPRALPNKETENWQIQTVAPVLTPSLVGAICYTTRSGNLWAYESNEDCEAHGIQRPLLTTRDCRFAYLTESDAESANYGDLDQAAIEVCKTQDDEGRECYDWEKLPYAKFGSSNNGRGKRAKEGRILCLLTKYSDLPVLVQLAPTSLNEWRTFSTGLRSAKADPRLTPYSVLVDLRITVEKKGGNAVAVVKPQVYTRDDEIIRLSAEEQKWIASNFTQPLADAFSPSAGFNFVHDEAEMS